MILNYIMLTLGMILLNLNIFRYLHIMQQSFYEYNDFVLTLKSTKKLGINFAEIILIILSGMLLLNNNNITLNVIWALVVLLTTYYQIKNKPKLKKKFAITFRVKTILSIIYAILIALISCVLYAYIKYQNYDPIISTIILLSIYKHFAIFIVILGNTLAKPIVNLVNRRYINDAKNILKEKKDMKIIGITGSYGKTSTKNIVGAILEEAYNTVITPKSFNTTLGVVRSIRENIRPYTDVFVCEMGANKLKDIEKICKIAKPDISVITSIGPQHLMTFKSIENVEKGKFEIIKNSKDNAVAVLNIDNEYINDGISKYALGKEVITYSLNNTKADYYVKDIKLSEEGSAFKVISKNDEYDIKTSLLGKHNIYNIICGIAIANLMNIDKEKIIRAVKKIKPIEHRLELKYMQNILTLDDSFNSNPEGSKAAIECLNSFENKYRVLVTPGMIELGEKTYELNKKLGNYAASLDYCILVGDKTTKPIKDGLDEEGYTNYEIVKDVYEAFTRLYEIKQKHNNLIALIENDLTDSYS